MLFILGVGSITGEQIKVLSNFTKTFFFLFYFSILGGTIGVAAPLMEIHGAAGKRKLFGWKNNLDEVDCLLYTIF